MLERDALLKSKLVRRFLETDDISIQQFSVYLHNTVLYAERLEIEKEEGMYDFGS